MSKVSRVYFRIDVKYRTHKDYDSDKEKIQWLKKENEETYDEALNTFEDIPLGGQYIAKRLIKIKEQELVRDNEVRIS